jgi:hypothetical protein
VPPAGITATAGDGSVALAWNAVASASAYNVKQSVLSNGPYAVIAPNLAGQSFTATGLTNGTKYYFAVSALNLAGESADAAAISAQPVSLAPPRLSYDVTTPGQLRIAWPQDHTSWRLQAQTNAIATGLRTNWMTVPGSTTTNQITLPTDASVGSVFFRLGYP